MSDNPIPTSGSAVDRASPPPAPVSRNGNHDANDGVPRSPAVASATTRGGGGGDAVGGATADGSGDGGDGGRATPPRARELRRLRRELERKDAELMTAARLGKGLLDREERYKRALASERAGSSTAQGELDAVWRRNAELRSQLATLQSVGRSSVDRQSSVGRSSVDRRSIVGRSSVGRR